jgi:hypothetical protein
MRRPAARPLLVLALAAAAAVAVCACGKSSPAATVTVVNTQAAHGASGGEGHARAGEGRGGGAAAHARALAFAHAVNIRAPDVPGFSPSTEREPKRKSTVEKRAERELHRCLGAAAHEAPSVVEAGSGEFERKAGLAGVSVSSSVTVERSPAAAAAVLAAFRSGRLRACLSHYFDLLLANQKLHGASVSPVSVKAGAPPAKGMTGSFGLRFTATIDVDRVHIPFYVDVLGFVDRSADVALLSSSIPRAFPARLEEQLFSLLLERARSHPV